MFSIITLKPSVTLIRRDFYEAPPPLEITEDSGFEESDLFRRKPFAESLTNLVIQAEGPLVISLDAPWGEGKTTFVKQWRGMLKKDENIASMYFDAFEGDYQDDAFLAISAEVYAYSKEKLYAQGDNEKKALTQFKTATINVSKALAKAGAKTAIKASSASFLDGSELENISAGVSAELGKLTDKLIDDALEKHTENKNSFTTFKIALETLGRELSSEGKPFIVIIDELDRCRPDFALNLLEKIKHVFSTSNVIFVLVNNSEQLARSVEYTYGQGINAHNYLHKFITLSLKLPKKADFALSMGDTKNYVHYLFRKMNIYAHGQEKSYSSLLGELCEELNLSFRQVEKIIGKLSLYMLLTPEHRYKDKHLISGLCILQVVRPELFEKVVNIKDYDSATTRDIVEKLLDFFGYYSYRDEEKTDWKSPFIITWQAVLQESKVTELPFVQILKEEIKQYDMSLKDLIPVVAEPLVKYWVEQPE
ncbi:P-loop NTPase fold protein [Neptuniibacter sp. PT34_22]|uniref:KAP family P-loop NTPase fold protein n=1 Tax=Neptuniibacter sp. PT34_22 TaxID=3398205 RepID=UPI0039F595B9